MSSIEHPERLASAARRTVSATVSGASPKPSSKSPLTSAAAARSGGSRRAARSTWRRASRAAQRPAPECGRDVPAGIVRNAVEVARQPLCPGPPTRRTTHEEHGSCRSRQGMVRARRCATTDGDSRASRTTSPSGRAAHTNARGMQREPRRGERRVARSNTVWEQHNTRASQPPTRPGSCANKP